MRRILIVFGIVTAAYLAVQTGNRGRFRKQILAFVTICYGVGFIYFTFLSRTPGYSRINVVPFYSLIRSLRYPIRMSNISQAIQTGQWSLMFTTLKPIGNALLNVFLFIPFGYLLPEWKKGMKTSQVLTAGLLLSLMIEIIQPITGLGWFDMDDLLCNFIGNALGVLLYAAGCRVGRRNKI